MKTYMIFFEMFLFVLASCQTGCHKRTAHTESLSLYKSKADNSDASVYSHYLPSMVDILPLTEIVRLSEAQEGSTMNVFVSLLDSFGSRIKSPGILRFELYEYVQRSAEPKGKRVIIWSDIDLSVATENNKYWRDFLRAYEFNLDFDTIKSGGYVLQVTFMRPGGKRLTDEFVLKSIQ